jgi:selenocysteine-specific elongation factor
LSARLRLLPYLRRPLPHNATVSFHTGAAETMARVRLLENERLEPGGSAWVQLVLSEPVALVKGDHFIIRSTTDTLGGGKVVDSHARRLRRRRPAIIQDLEVKEKGTIEEVVVTLLETTQPIELPSLLTKSDLPDAEVRQAIELLIQQEKVKGVGEGGQRLLFTASGWVRLTDQATAVLQDYHKKYPTRIGMPKAELGSRLKLGRYSPVIWQKLSGEGIISEEGSAVRLTSHKVTLSQSQQVIVDDFLRSLSQNPYSPPSDRIPEPDLLNLLIERQQVVKVSDNIVFAASAYEEMLEKVIDYIKIHGKVTVGEVRDMFNTSRKYVLALLEYLDEKKITRRVGDERVLY